MKFVIDLNSLIPFLNSNFFIGLATFLTGFAAFLVYLWQKRDKKINAARVILSEIRNAESKISQVQKRLAGTNYEDFPSILPSNSWEKFSYMFAHDFDSDQLDKINNFFSNCQAIEELAKRDNNFFWITSEERARVVQQQIPQIIAASFDAKTGKLDEIKKKTLIETFMTAITNEPYAYVPQKTLKAIKLILDNLPQISDTPIGEKFKKLSK